MGRPPIYDGWVLRASIEREMGRERDTKKLRLSQAKHFTTGLWKTVQKGSILGVFSHGTLPYRINLSNHRV